MEKNVETEVIKEILQLYGIHGQLTEQKIYIHGIEDDGRLKIIFCATLESGRKLVVKILHEDHDLEEEYRKVERQSVFSEVMRNHGIKTPARYQANGKYCNRFFYHDMPCMITVEDWCGEEITQITTETARQIGELMAKMHTISLERKYEIGRGTLNCFPSSGQ